VTEKGSKALDALLPFLGASAICNRVWTYGSMGLKGSWRTLFFWAGPQVLSKRQKEQRESWTKYFRSAPSKLIVLVVLGW
jgi:hypothetical protein